MRTGASPIAANYPRSTIRRRHHERLRATSLCSFAPVRSRHIQTIEINPETSHPMTFTENAKAHARAELGMGDDEPNAATGATGHAEFEWIASIFDSGFEAGRREGAETALKYAADNIVFSDEWRNHGNNDPRLDGEAEASAWLEVEASRPLPLTAGDFTETGTPDA